MTKNRAINIILLSYEKHKTKVAFWHKRELGGGERIFLSLLWSGWFELIAITIL